jgi:tRNA U34 5-carboxymethylaminomethyl modifying GTPase MnmE/TrmE
MTALTCCDVLATSIFLPPSKKPAAVPASRGRDIIAASPCHIVRMLRSAASRLRSLASQRAPLLSAPGCALLRCLSQASPSGEFQESEEDADSIHSLPAACEVAAKDTSLQARSRLRSSLAQSSLAHDGAQKTVRVALLGAPNAGKSSLSNALAGSLVRLSPTLSALAV